MKPAKSNASLAHDQYVMWLKNYPGDFAGAVQAASDFIETESDLEAFGRIITTGSEDEPEEPVEPLGAILARAELRTIEAARRLNANL